MTRASRYFAWLVLLVVAAALAADPAASPPDQPATPSQEELEKKFAEELSGATLVGHYTVDGSTAPKEERYELAKVTKLEGHLWRFDARIVYGEHDVKLPLPIAVAWAGDTPVITLSDLTVPGLGTYSARVMIYRGQYAGVWRGGDHGGQLFGRVEKQDAANVDAKSDKSQETNPKTK